MEALYYAHAMCTYGTIAEEFELKQIRTGFRRVRIVNPASFDGHPEKRKDTVGFCLRLVEKCDAVVFSRLMGKVTAGVGKK
jgi:anaerobic glycerol-3-phosphate dehydrogenase